jgi:hypothetical protein
MPECVNAVAAGFQMFIALVKDGLEASRDAY